MNGREPKLVVLEGANQGSEIPLDDRALLLGRDAGSDLVLFDSYASRHHCWIEPRGDEWWIRDLGSKNGTLVGDTRVDVEQRLFDGDVIIIGRTRIRFCDADATRTYSGLTAQSAERLIVDGAARSVWVDGVELDPPLSPKQWRLLRLLSEQRGKPVTKDAIARVVWPEAEGAIYDYQIDKLVSRLRARLGEVGEQLIETVWGVGYRLR